MEPYDPKTDKYPYPKKTDAHYLVIKKDNGLVFDKDYPYIDNSKGFRFKQFLVRVLLRLIVFPMTKIRLGLKVENKKNLRIYKEALSKGFINCSNHVHLWDYLCIMRTLKPKKPRVIVWAPNVRGENAALVRLVGGIPIPEHDLQATLAYYRTLQKFVENGGALQVYPEGSMWEYYAPIRPFKHGVAYLSIQFDRPVLPMGFSYRKPSWIRRKIFHQIATFNLSVGEPLYPSKELKGKEAEIEFTKRIHEAVCRLSHIDPEKNIYPPIFDNNERIDY